MDIQSTVSFYFLCFIIVFLFFVWPSNKWHCLKISEIKTLHVLVIGITSMLMVLISVSPMSWSPYWNGTITAEADKQQYDRLGDALLQWRLYIDNNDIDPALKAMENPYDYQARKQSGVKYNWDEAYYNNHYYMYFGVVPTIILFVPFKLITGTALLSYQATQVFAGFTVLGIFYLFFIVGKNFFPSMPYSLYLLLASSLSILSIGFSISAPALYCTAIVSAVCLMIWSIVCFIKAVWLQEDGLINSVFLFTGGLLGALVFGCRPPVALANLLVISVVLQIFANDILLPVEKTKKIFFLLLPYFLVGIVLMLYNYARFDNVFEFGQSYQLTLADQHNYGNFSERFDVEKLLVGISDNFIKFNGFSDKFPFIRFNGAFINFPILLFSVCLFSKRVTRYLVLTKLYGFSLLLFFIPLIITLFDVYWSPFLLERYRLDFYYLLCIVCFIVIATLFKYVSGQARKLLIGIVIILSFAVFVVEFLFFCILCYQDQ